MTTDAILFVDDEELVLSSYQRVLRKQFHFDVASSGQQALDKIASDGPYAVLLSDMRMPGMTGLELLRRVKSISPQTVRIMLTGNSDVRTAVDAVNEGSVFRFLTKPCEPDILAATIKDGLRDYHLMRAEKELLEQTLQGSIRVLTDVLGLVNPAAFHETQEVSRYVKRVVQQMKLDDPWQYEVAAMLSNLGALVVSSESPFGRPQSGFGAHAEIAERLLRNIPRLEKVAAIIGELGITDESRRHSESPDNPVRLGGEILRACAAFREIVQQGVPSQTAVKKLRDSAKGAYRPALLEALGTLQAETVEYQARVVGVQTLSKNMILDEDLISTAGMLLVTNGTSITDSLLIRLQNFRQRRVLPAEIRVRIPVMPLR